MIKLLLRSPVAFWSFSLAVVGGLSLFSYWLLFVLPFPPLLLLLLFVFCLSVAWLLALSGLVDLWIVHLEQQAILERGRR